MKTILAPLALIALVVSPAAAQEHQTFTLATPPIGAVAVGTWQAEGQAGMNVAMPFGGMEILNVEPMDFGERVTGAPYSARAVTEVTQSLADGNRIERRSANTVARDSQGRVRREQQIAAIGPFMPQGDAKIVTIIDPVAGVHYSLDERRKVAVRLPMPASNLRARAGVRARIATATPAGAMPRTTEPRTEQLAPQQIEGVQAEGTRVTTTIPAGTIGNQAPINIVGERWFSPELKVVMLSQQTDPRFGETIYRLENVVRAEPAAELFQVPADYKIEEARMRMNMPAMPVK
jgi:hypothetical protein